MKYEKKKVLVQYPDDEKVEEWTGQIEEEEIETSRLETVRELREKVDMTQRKFDEYTGIPVRSIQNLESSVTSCPDYITIFISEKIYTDFFKKE